MENELARRRQSGRREPSAASKAVRVLERSWPRELVGETVDASRLSREQGEELLVLAEKRKEGEELSAAEQRRFEHLAGVAAGNESVFEEKRNMAAVKAKKDELLEKMRVANLPRRVEWAEVGSVTLPRFLFEWLETSRNESFTVADLGMLAAMLYQFENRVSLFTDARFEDENGEAVLVLQSIEGLRYPLQFVGGLRHKWPCPRARCSQHARTQQVVRNRPIARRLAGQARRAGDEAPGGQREGGVADSRTSDSPTTPDR